jgi:hypothetical protein
LDRLVDFDRINAGMTRFSAGGLVAGSSRAGPTKRNQRFIRQELIPSPFAPPGFHPERNRTWSNLREFAQTIQ